MALQIFVLSLAVACFAFILLVATAPAACNAYSVLCIVLMSAGNLHFEYFSLAYKFSFLQIKRKLTYKSFVDEFLFVGGHCVRNEYHMRI